MYSEVRDTMNDEEEEEGNDGVSGEEVLGYWSNPEAEVRQYNDRRLQQTKCSQTA